MRNRDYSTKKQHEPSTAKHDCAKQSPPPRENDLTNTPAAPCNNAMSRYHGEQVLVVPRTAFDAVGSFQGVNLAPEQYLRAFLQPGIAHYIDRGLAENSPEYKQIIAYAIFRHNGRILAYTRGGSGGEARLHDKISVGIGGHINPVDGLADNLDTYMAGVEREIREELRIEGAYTQKLFAAINDDSNPVGSVHLGIVHCFDLETDQIAANETALANLRFHTLEELAGPSYERLETWSQLCVDALR